MTPPSPAAIAAAHLIQDEIRAARVRTGFIDVIPGSDAIAAIIDRHISATASAGWQGMESAAMDGTSLIGLVAYEEDGETIYRATDIFHPVGHRWLEDGLTGHHECDPLGWMHKPAAPTPSNPI